MTAEESPPPPDDNASQANDATTGARPSQKRSFQETALRWVNLAAGTIVLLLAGMVLYDSLRTVIVVEQFSVPEAFEKNGLTGTVLANQLIDSINRLRPDLKQEPPPHAVYASLPSSVLDALYRVPVAISPSLQPPDLEIPKTGLSLKAVSRYLASWLGGDRFRISGELVFLDDRLRLVVRIGDEAEVFEQPTKQPQQSVDDLLIRASRHLYRKFQPLVWLSWQCQESARSCEVALRQYGKHWADDQLILGQFVAGLIQSLHYRYEDAEAYFDAVMIAPEPAASSLQQHLIEIRSHACVDKALALKAQNRVPEALRTFENPICQRHLNAGSHWADALLMLQRADEAVSKAEAAVLETDKARLADPRSPYLQYSAGYANYVLGRAYFEQRRYDNAITKFDQAAKHNEHYHWTFYWWAKTLQAQGKPGEAEAKLRKIGDLAEGESIPVRYLRAALLVQTGRPHDAIGELHETLRINPGYADPYFDLCVLYQETGSVLRAAAHCHAYRGFFQAMVTPNDESKAKVLRASRIVGELAALRSSR